MNCPIIGFPGTTAQRRNGTLFFQFPNGPILPLDPNNTVAVTVSNPGDLANQVQADANNCCRVEFFWDSSLILIGPTELSAYFGGFGPQYQTPTPPIGTPGSSILFNGSTQFSIGWTTANVCYDTGTLYAQAQLDPEYGPGGNCPQSPPPNSTPTNVREVYNAARHVTIGEPCGTNVGVQRVATQVASHAEAVSPLDNRTCFAAAIVNRAYDQVVTRVDVRSVLKDDLTYPEHTRISELLDLGGRWLRAKDVRVGLGVERVVGAGSTIGRPGNLGAISNETFRRLRNSDLDHRQEVGLVGRETRQILLEIEHPHAARPHDFFVFEVGQYDDSRKGQRGGAIVVACGDWMLRDV